MTWDSDRVTVSGESYKREHRQRRQERLDRNQEVIDLHRREISNREIARRLGLHRKTVRKWLRADCYPERASPRYRCGVDGWTDYLQERWRADCRNASGLTAELRSRGFNGSYDMVRRYVGQWRQREVPRNVVPRSPSPLPFSPSSVARLLFNPSDQRKPEQQRLAQLFCEACPEADRAVRVTHEFRSLMTERRADELDGWIGRAGRIKAVRGGVEGRPCGGDGGAHYAVE